MYVYVYTIVLGGVACYNSGWGCYSNNHYLCDTLIYNIIVLGGVAHYLCDTLIYDIIVLGGVACYNSGWGCCSNNHYLCDTLIYNIIVPRRCGLL